VLYGHQLNAFQWVGLTLAVVAMIANFTENKKHGGGGHGGAGAGENDRKEALPQENQNLLAPDDSDHEEESATGGKQKEKSNQASLQAKGIELTSLRKLGSNVNERKKDSDLESVDLMNFEDEHSSKKGTASHQKNSKSVDYSQLPDAKNDNVV
jgi:hypothetical protein